MPYPFAHPAAVLPLAPLMGRLAVPSALVIGSMVPDLWQVLPFGSRQLSHSASGLIFFSLPVGLAVYLLFHLLFKDAFLALLAPPLASRLQAFAVRGLPGAPLHGVFASLVLGALTHLVWDRITHSHAAGMESINWLQHASTLLGSLVIGWWLWRKLRNATPVPARTLSPVARACAAMTLLLTAAAAAGWTAYEWPPISADIATVRRIARTAAEGALHGLIGAALLYSLTWKLWPRLGER